MNTTLRLLALSLAVGFYQLPVLKDRTASLHFFGAEGILVSALDRVDALVGAPAAEAQHLVESQKIQAEASLLRVFSSEAPVVDAASIVPAPELVSVHPSQSGTSVQSAKEPAGKTLSAAASRAGAATGQSDATGPTKLAGNPPSAQASASTTAEIGSAPNHADKVHAAGTGTVLLVGDSVMGEIAYGMKRWSAKNKGWTVVDAHKVSSGLCNSGYYDWPTVFQELVAQNKPTVVAMMVGANDQQDIFAERKRLNFGSPAWVQAYSERIHSILHTAQAANARVYWVLPPVMRDETLEMHMVTVRRTIREALAGHAEAVLIEDGARFADKDGHYAENAVVNGKTRALRVEDGVHLTALGAQIFVDSLLQAAFSDTSAATPAAAIPTPSPAEAPGEPSAPEAAFPSHEDGPGAERAASAPATSAVGDPN